MPQDRKIFTLLQVSKSIQKTISNRYGTSFWVKAEMNKLNYYSHSGHCYPDIVEKVNGKVVAQMRCLLWKDDFLKINNNFKRILKEPLKDGIKILFLANIQYNPQYGLSLQIIDIDPSFSLGDLEKEKQNTINTLKQKGIYSNNKMLKMPLLPKRIAIISVETSKGYADFLEILKSYKAEWNYTFFQMLFPSLLQGDKAVPALIRQLRRIKTVRQHFDVVAILRGGGGDIGLSCYNNYELAQEIATYPIPVLSGIGHSTNETVTEMVSHENAITPSKLAEFLIQKFHNFSVPVEKAREKINEKSLRLIEDKKSKFSSEVKSLQNITKHILSQYNNEINQKANTLVQESNFKIRKEKENIKFTNQKIDKNSYRFCLSEQQNINQIGLDLKKEMSTQFKESNLILANIEKNLNNLSPENVLKRGYSITKFKGKSVNSSVQLKEGNILETILYRGKLTSTVKTIEKPKNNE